MQKTSPFSFDYQRKNIVSALFKSGFFLTSWPLFLAKSEISYFELKKYLTKNGFLATFFGHLATFCPLLKNPKTPDFTGFFGLFGQMSTFSPFNYVIKSLLIYKDIRK